MNDRESTLQDRTYAPGFQKKDCNYRIYSRISREILVKFRTLFYEIDLYAGHKIYSPNTHFLKHLRTNNLKPD